MSAHQEKAICEVRKPPKVYIRKVDKQREETEKLHEFSSQDIASFQSEPFRTVVENHGTTKTRRTWLIAV